MLVLLDDNWAVFYMDVDVHHGTKGISAVPLQGDLLKGRLEQYTYHTVQHLPSPFLLMYLSACNVSYALLQSLCKASCIVGTLSGCELFSLPHGHIKCPYQHFPHIAYCCCIASSAGTCADLTCFAELLSSCQLTELPCLANR